ncbi:MAG: DUF1353 domain-containing protein [Leptospirales bacterium]|jgi:hypothetical protein
MNASADNKIRYKRIRKYKYQLMADYQLATGLNRANAEPARVPGDYVVLAPDGLMTIKQGYAWDGPSGPTFDTKNFMRGSLVHDAFYQLIREKELSAGDRAFADRLLRDHCREDGMSALRAFYVWKAVAWFGKSSATPEPPPPVRIAP